MPNITELTPDHTAALYQLYRRQTAGLPHCLAPSAERFAADLGRPEAGQIFVAETGGHASGFAAWRPVTDDDDREINAVTALFFDEEAAGAALLEACRSAAGPGPLHAFPQTSGNAPVQGYNAGWDGLSDRMAPQARLLARHGFAPRYRELLLACDLGAPFESPDALHDLRLEATIGSSGNYLQRAWAGEERIGLCIYNTLQGASDDPRAARVGAVYWVWSDDAHRRRGVGRALMLRALAHMRSIGCEHCWLGTGADNWPAQALYLALGFAVVDSAASFIRPG